ncbi:hypothetical protein [Lacinutrix algicola]|uniref:hypothetical protein n=1 Tax=Lacinutrix algicola TaxID=342954 RepID=UPI0006E3F399|nr:hypothetical protein [Lacinutrix algicola]
MKNLKTINLLFLALLLSVSIYGQQRALSNIERNINKEAAGLEQSLNFTLDTLTLKSDKNILRVTFLSHDEKDSVIIDVDAPEIKIPLYHFKQGRYTIAVYREDKIIALGVKRVEDIARPKNAIEDLEESILRSSLSKEEQIARNIKPLKKKTNVVEDLDTRVAIAKSRVKKDKPVEIKTKAAKEEDTSLAIAKPIIEKEEDRRVAVAKPRAEKEKVTPIKRVNTRKEREPKVVSNVNKKNIFEIAAEREEAKKAMRLKNENNRVVTSVTKNEPSKKPTTLIEVKKVTYNLSQIDNDKTVDRQTREEYRANNLRPNGTRYEN